MFSELSDLLNTGASFQFDKNHCTLSTAFRDWGLECMIILSESAHL